MGIYDRVITADENKLDKEFVSKFRNKLKKGSRGFGYWSWKPQIILQTLEAIEDGDIIQYTDAGCHLNKEGIDRLKYYFDIAESAQSGILAFKADPPSFHDGRKLLDLQVLKWTKGDLFDYFKVRDDKNITHTQTIGAGVIFVRKCNDSIKLLNEWIKVIESDFSLIDDTPSRSLNFDGFIEHRHDQGIFSILCILNGVTTLSAYEYWYPQKDSFKPDWEALKGFPIHAKRDKDFGLIRRVLNKLKNSLKKIKSFMR
jgi:hypothetical protein